MRITVICLYMKLIVLGSGTSVPHPRRASTAHWLEDRNTEHCCWTSALTLLIAWLRNGSTGPTLMRSGSVIFISTIAAGSRHFSSARVGAANAAAPQTAFSVRGPKVSSNPQGHRPGKQLSLVEQPFPLEVVELEPGSEFEILPGVHARTFSTPHTKESLAIRLTDATGQVLVYTSDTGYSDELAEFARDAHFLLMECSFYRNKPVKTHLELDEAMQLAGSRRPQKLLLNHLIRSGMASILLPKQRSFGQVKQSKPMTVCDWNFIRRRMRHCGKYAKIFSFYCWRLGWRLRFCCRRHPTAKSYSSDVTSSSSSDASNDSHLLEIGQCGTTTRRTAVADRNQGCFLQHSLAQRRRFAESLANFLKRDPEIGGALFWVYRKWIETRSGQETTTQSRLLADELGMHYAWAAPPSPKAERGRGDRSCHFESLSADGCASNRLAT